MWFTDILKSNYNDLLNMLGLSNVAFVIISLLLISILALVYMLKRMGILFHKIQIKKEKMPQCTLLYVQYQGEYMHLSPQFNRISKQTKSTFPKSITFGIYYDNPAVVDSKKCRAVLGLIIHPEEQLQVQHFTKKYFDYEKKVVKSCEVFTTTFPYYNQITFMLLPMKVYPQLHKQCPEEMKYGVMEQYLLKDGKIKLAVGSQQFELSAFERPENKKSQ